MKNYQKMKKQMVIETFSDRISQLILNYYHDICMDDSLTGQFGTEYPIPNIIESQATSQKDCFFKSYCSQ